MLKGNDLTRHNDSIQSEGILIRKRSAPIDGLAFIRSKPLAS